MQTADSVSSKKAKTKVGKGRRKRVKRAKRRLDARIYERELLRLQTELVKLAAWVKGRGLKVVALFEGRDAAGKGGTIKRITEAVSPRTCQVVALASPARKDAMVLSALDRALAGGGRNRALRS